MSNDDRETAPDRLLSFLSMLAFVACLGAWIVGICVFVGVCLSVVLKLAGFAQDVEWWQVPTAFAASVVLVGPATYLYVRDQVASKSGRGRTS